MYRKPFCLVSMFLFFLWTGALSASDIAREQRLGNQIRDAIMDGEVIELSAGDVPFMAIEMEAEEQPAKGAVMVLHGRGMHPEWEDVVQPLRTLLPEHGWHTLALQLPVLDKQAKYYDYEKIFPEAHPRLEAALNYLQEAGFKRIVIVAHSCGAHMAMDWIRERGDEGLFAYVGIGMGATDYKQPMHQPFPLAQMKVPVLDIYGSEEYPAVLRMAPQRKAAMAAAGNEKSTQRVIDGAEHYFKGQGEELVEAVADWLNKL